MTRLNLMLKLVLATIAIISVSFFVVLNLQSKIKEKSEWIFEKRSMLMILEEREENLARLKKDYDTVKEKLPILKKSLPEEDNFERFLGTLENLASVTNNNQILNFEPLDNSKLVGEKTKSLKFSANLTGSAESFARYIENLQKLPYFIKIENISVKNDSGISSSNSQMTLNMRLYMQ